MPTAGGRWRAALVCAALTMTTVAPIRAAGVPISQATEDQKKSAQTLFKRGVDRAKKGEHDKALAEFRASYDIVASANTRVMISRELAALGRRAEAYREALGAVEVAKAAALEDKRYAEAEVSARAEADELKKTIGLLKVDLADRTGELVVGGRTVPLRETSAPIVVDPGEVKVVLRGLGGIDERTVTIAAGEEGAVSFAEKAAPPPPPRPKKEKPPMHPFDQGDGELITALTLGSVGVVGMVFFAGFGSANASIHDELEAACPNDRCPASLEDKAAEGQAFKTVANVSVGFGIFGLAAGAAFLVPTFFKPDPTTAQLRFGPGSLFVGGSF